MAVGAARRVHFHKLPAARIQVDDARILNQAVGDRIEQSDLREETQRFGVIGDRARQPDQPLVSLEDDNVDARQRRADWRASAQPGLRR